MSFKLKKKRQKQKRNVKIIFPSTITTFVMIFGFVAIIKAADGKFSTACIMVMLSMVMDGLDGKLARFTNTASEFGIQYDSLSDLVAFGVAPCVIYYHFYLQGHVTDQVYYLLPIMYLTCGAIRLARFNVTASIYGKRHFTGLPIPAAAFTVVTGPLVFDWATQAEIFTEWGLAPHLNRENFFQVSVALIIALSLSMISAWKFDTPAKFWFHRFERKGVNYVVLIGFIALNLISFEFFALGISSYYIFSMWARALMNRISKGALKPRPELQAVVEQAELEDEPQAGTNT